MKRATSVPFVLAKLASAAALLAATASVQAVEFVSISGPGPFAAGSTFSLWLEDDVVPAGGFTDADIQVSWDPAVLSLVSVQPPGNSAFGPIQPIVSIDPFPGEVRAWQQFMIIRDVNQPLPMSFGSEILRLDFAVSATNLASETEVWFTPAFLVIDSSTYYNFSGVTALISITPVPEPATLAMLLAGLGVVAGCAARRRP